MTILPLVHPSHPILYERTTPFNFDDKEWDAEKLASDMVETMKNLRGMGLSANQVGIPLSVFCMDGPIPYVLFNPKVVNIDGDLLEMEEGCLSFPGLVVKIKRHNSVRVRFQVPSGATVTKEFMGMSARCVQHEMQHLSGVPFVTGIGRLRLENSLKKAKKIGYDYTNIGLMKYAISSLQ